MEIEKTMTVAAPIDRVWKLLLDPKVMAGCVPGTQSVTEISDVEYFAEVKVKISFISARFKIKTKILETRPPNYLRCEGTGEDSTVASSMKQTSELFLTDLGARGTELRIKSKADVLGRLGSFGLSIMKTKADRMWDEFGANFAAIAQQGQTTEGNSAPQPTSGAVGNDAAENPSRLPMTTSADGPKTTAAQKPTQHLETSHVGFWKRILGSTSRTLPSAHHQRLPTDIYVELQRGNSALKILWPASAADECAKWLKDELKQQ